MPQPAVAIFGQPTSAARSTDIVTWQGGPATFSVQGDLDGGTVYIKVALDLAEETAARFANFADDLGAAVSLSGTTDATDYRGVTVDLPQCNLFLTVVGGTSPTPDVGLSMHKLRSANV